MVWMRSAAIGIVAVTTGLLGFAARGVDARDQDPNQPPVPVCNTCDPGKSGVMIKADLTPLSTGPIITVPPGRRFVLEYVSAVVFGDRCNRPSQVDLYRNFRDPIASFPGTIEATSDIRELMVDQPVQMYFDSGDVIAVEARLASGGRMCFAVGAPDLRSFVVLHGRYISAS